MNRSAVITTLLCAGLSIPAQAQRPEHAADAAPQPIDWRTAESGILARHVQLTMPDRFTKAGESYFSPDETMVIFQAIERPADGGVAPEYYGMYVGDLVRTDGRITGLADVRRISPEGSANTCGWFHPSEAGTVLFASTITPPSPGAPPGYNRAQKRYRWMFPPEMRIVRTTLDRAHDAQPALEPVAGDGSAYCAEGSYSPDGRHVVYCSLASGAGDLRALDLETGHDALLVTADGYDGGPFFSPDGRRLCYRSDREGNHLLQLFVAELAFDDNGTIRGIEKEIQLTRNASVNWAPFWHPDGRRLVYATSQVGHHNYEVFMIDADPGDLPGAPGPVRYGTHDRRITHADRADVLPAFNGDGSVMIWTSQRGEDGSSQLWLADFVALDE